MDPVLDYNIYKGEFYSENADKILKYIKSNHLRCEWIFELMLTLITLQLLIISKNKLRAKIGIGKGVKIL